VAITEACFNPQLALGVEVEGVSESPDELFGEGASTVIISAPEENTTALREIFAPLEAIVVGRVTSTLRLRIANVIDENISELLRLYENALPQRLGST
jgi:hypothetical protein